MAINVIALLIFVFSAYSNRISPHFSVFFSYLGMIFPFIFIAVVFGSVVLLVAGRWKWSIAYGITILICWGSVSTYFPFHFKTTNVPEDCIKLLTYNVMKFEHEKPHTKEKPNAILKYIANSDADIVCIQEYASTTSGNHLKENDIKKTLNSYPYSRLLKLKQSRRSEIIGMAIFSRFPILSFREIPFDSKYNGSFMVELDINGKKTTLINNHLESNKLSMEERNEYYGLTKEFDSQKLDNLTIKITKRLTPAFKERAEQAAIVSEYIKNDKNPYIIVCGDFNDTPISYSRYKIKGNLRDAFVDTGSGLGISYNSHRFLFRIDYILHSKNIKAYNCTVDRSIRNSDHYPVCTYLQLN
ncbi:MAG: endonuclease/exonuclease/phosphatase family protein [Dysgonamonadaceae bacterium]|nr:endonuclease/exonuclease/phosphatase family protein [Dysgonamonadaceae bacterium]